ncbi:bacterial transcriptional activator domain-containing protein [Mesorhizobium sp. M0074]|uniref:AfsR/SARP family transcriptional regulator n=1 Tax=Mesorhizobium sp. M0074 TaxID=2956869 RepID=UPI00333DDB1F
MAVAALDRLLAHYCATSDAASCVRVATRLLAMEPLREDIHRTLMRAYVAQGRVNLALKQYESCRDALRRQLDLRPESETRKLYEDLRARRTSDAAFPTARAQTGSQAGNVRISQVSPSGRRRATSNRPESTSLIR